MTVVVEWLKFRVPSENRERFIQIDDQIWSAALSGYDGYLGKAVWFDPNAPDAVILVIQWASREQWKSIPTDALEEVEQRFDEAVEFDYEMVESKEFQIRRFMTTTV